MNGNDDNESHTAPVVAMVGANTAAPPTTANNDDDDDDDVLMVTAGDIPDNHDDHDVVEDGVTTTASTASAAAVATASAPPLETAVAVQEDASTTLMKESSVTMTFHAIKPVHMQPEQSDNNTTTTTTKKNNYGNLLVLHGPALFFSYQDAKKFLQEENKEEGSGEDEEALSSNNNNNNHLEYRTFSTIEEAVIYLSAGSNNNFFNNDKNKKRSIASSSTTATILAKTKKRQRQSTSTSSSSSSVIQVNRIKQSEFDKMMVVLQHFQTQYHHVKVPGPFSKKVPVDAKYDKLRQWTAMLRQVIKDYKEKRYCPLTEWQLQQLADIGFIPRSTIVNNKNKKRSVAGAAGATTTSTTQTTTTTTSSTDSQRWKTPTSAHNLLKLKRELEDSWDASVQLLHDYKLQKGHAHVPKRPNKSLEIKYLPLCKFAGWMQQFLMEVEEQQQQEASSSLPQQHFFLTAERRQQLQDVGFACTTPSQRVNARTMVLLENNQHNHHSNKDNFNGDNQHQQQHYFDVMVAKLKRCKEEGRPLKSNRELEWWVAEQRKQYALFKAAGKTDATTTIATSSTTMTAERIAILAEAGFPFEKNTAPTWDERAVEWLEFKTKMGRDPMREEASLYQWVYKQRAKYREQQQMEEGDTNKTKKRTNNLTGKQIKRLTDWGFNWEMKFQFPNMSKPASWEERFEELIKYKEENGTCQAHKNVPILGQWVKQQRKEYRYYVQGSKPSRMTQERISKLSSIGFDFGEQRWNTGKMKQAHAAIEKGRAQESAAIMNNNTVQLLQVAPPLDMGDGEGGDAIQHVLDHLQQQQQRNSSNNNSDFQQYQQDIHQWDQQRYNV